MCVPHQGTMFGKGLIPDAATSRSIGINSTTLNAVTDANTSGNDIVVCANNLQFCINICLHNLNTI